MRPSPPATSTPSSPQVHVWTLKSGRATRFWQYQGDQQAEDEFWSMAA